MLALMQDEELLRFRLRTEYAAPNLLEVQDVVIKAGPRAWKSAALLTFGDKQTGEVTGRTLRVQTWWRKNGGYGFEAKSDLRWSCDGAEISKLSEFLRAELPSAGTYILLEESSATATAARLVAENTTTAAAVVVELLAVEEVRNALASSGAAESGAALVNRQRQKAALERLREVVGNPRASERELQNTLSGEWWLFGGRFVGQHRRRQFTSLDQLDIPLLRADGSLHVVELKRAGIPDLVMDYRNHLVPGPDVHTAVGQTMNYLRALDEQYMQIRQDFGIDTRRSTATVVIGHPDHCPSHSEEEVAQTFRTYNSHLARIEVISYAELLAGATAALNVVDSPTVNADNDQPERHAAERPNQPVDHHDSSVDPWASADDSTNPRITRENNDPWATPAGYDPWAGGDRWTDEPPF